MKLGEITTVKVDPTTNEGYDEAPAIVTRVYDDGSLRLRVFGTVTADEVRNYVGEDGEPFDKIDTAPAPTAEPAAPATPATPPAPATTTAGTPGGPDLTAMAQQFIAWMQGQGGQGGQGGAEQTTPPASSTDPTPSESAPSGDTASAGA